MTFFISGGAKNGKSTLAQDLTVALAEGGKHYYVATMISTGEEDDDRIRRHIADRDGMGFETVECFRNILDCLDVADKEGVFLVDSVTAMVQNVAEALHGFKSHTIPVFDMPPDPVIIFGTGGDHGGNIIVLTTLCQNHC